MEEGYVFMVGTCGQCKRMFTFNPHKVPSMKNIPFCKHCVDWANNGPRKANGLPPIVYSSDAYEAIPESQL